MIIYIVQRGAALMAPQCSAVDGQKDIALVFYEGCKLESSLDPAGRGCSDKVISY